MDIQLNGTVLRIFLVWINFMSEIIPIINFLITDDKTNLYFSVHHPHKESLQGGR